MKIKTKCVHGNIIENNPTGAISVPIYQAATFVHPGVGQSTGYDYSRLQNPTREHVEKIVANLENGIDALAFSSGMAAIMAVMELFEPQDHIICSDDLYGGSQRLFDNISKKNQLEIDYIDSSNSSAVKNLINNGGFKGELLTPFFMFLLGLTLTNVAFWLEVKKAKEELTKLLEQFMEY